MGGGGWGYGV